MQLCMLGIRIMLLYQIFSKSYSKCVPKADHNVICHEIRPKCNCSISCINNKKKLVIDC